MSGYVSSIFQLATRIQQIAAPTFQEENRAALVHELFRVEGLADIDIDTVGNVYACLQADLSPQEEKAAPVIVSAHLDTVFPYGTPLDIHQEEGRLYGPGIGDNSLGVAGLFGLLWLLREQCVSLPFNLWLVANVCEEGLGNLRGMKAVVERFGRTAQAFIILEGMALGHIYHRGLGVRRYKITVRTPGGHSWIDYGRPSAIHELARLCTRITNLEIPHQPRTTINIGTITGGTSINTIAPEASLELDLRSESMPTLEKLVSDVVEICSEGARKDTEVVAEEIGNRPAGEIPASHPLVHLVASCLQAQGVEPRLAIGSTDANIPLSCGLPAVTIALTTGAGAHTVNEYINISPLEKGMNSLLSIIRGLSSLTVNCLGN